MNEQMWDGITVATTLHPEMVALRHKLADAAKAADWSSLLDILAIHPELVNSTRIGGQSGYAPLHQAAYAGAPESIMRLLLLLGAWRTLRTTDGERPVDIARRRGHTQLAAILEPDLARAIAPEPLLMIQQHFHAVILGRAEQLVREHALRHTRAAAGVSRADLLVCRAGHAWRLQLPPGNDCGKPGSGCGELVSRGRGFRPAPPDQCAWQRVARREVCVAITSQRTSNSSACAGTKGSDTKGFIFSRAAGQ